MTGAQGMAAMPLRSGRAVAMSVYVARAFVRMLQPVRVRHHFAPRVARKQPIATSTIVAPVAVSA